MKRKQPARIQASQDRRFLKLLAKIAEERTARIGGSVVETVRTTTTMTKRGKPDDAPPGTAAKIAGVQFFVAGGPDRIVQFDDLGQPARYQRVEKIKWRSGPVVVAESFGRDSMDINREFAWTASRPSTPGAEEQP